MPIETNPQTPADLDKTWPRDLDVVREGAAHIRNVKQVIQGLEAIGTIKLFYGSVAAIAPGWAVCDGANGTPDMRGRFPVGAGGTYALDDTGGADSVTITEATMPWHNHSADPAGGHDHGGAVGAAGGHSHSTGSAGGHSHTGSTNTTGSHVHGQRMYQRSESTTSLSDIISTVRTSTILNSVLDTNSAGDHSHTLTTNSTGSHTHSVSTVGNHSHGITAVANHSHVITKVGGGEAHENRPPYRALFFIMKIE